MPRNRDDYDDDEPRPRSKRRMDDDDDDNRPARKSRRSNDDDRPSSKRHRVEDDDDDDRPMARRRRDRENDEEDYDDRPRRKKSKKKAKQLSVLGIISLLTGGFALMLSFTCIGGLAVIPALIGIGLGVMGLIASRQSRGRQEPVLPISGMVVSTAATVVSVIAIVSFFQTVDDVRQVFKEAQEEQAKRKEELAKAATEVKAAQAGTVMRVTAVQFYNAYEDDERADGLYKNKILEVTGTFHEVDFRGFDEFGGVFIVHLKAGPDQFDTVGCHFAKDANVRAQLARLVPGQQVIIRGKCLGGGPVIEACILFQ
jgi:hypothetical protein